MNYAPKGFAQRVESDANESEPSKGGGSVKPKADHGGTPEPIH